MYLIRCCATSRRGFHSHHKKHRGYGVARGVELTISAFVVLAEGTSLSTSEELVIENIANLEACLVQPSAFLLATPEPRKQDLSPHWQ